MAVEIKFCGMTRPEDILEAHRLGANYVGVILAGGPRQLDVDRATRVIAAAPTEMRRVGVFPRLAPRIIGEQARTIGLTTVQLHGDPTPDELAAVRREFSGEVWTVLRLAEAMLPPHASQLFAEADGVVLDALVAGRLGGTGVALPWRALAPLLAAVGGRAKLILAGGLRAENVREALDVLRPHVVDVSSGVESAPGIKDHARMRAFREAVRESR